MQMQDLSRSDVITDTWDHLSHTDRIASSDSVAS